MRRLRPRCLGRLGPCRNSSVRRSVRRLASRKAGQRIRYLNMPAGRPHRVSIPMAGQPLCIIRRTRINSISRLSCAVRPTDGQLNTGDPAFRTTAGSSLNSAFVSQVIETNSISAVLFAAAELHIDLPCVSAYSATSRIVEWLPAGR